MNKKPDRLDIRLSNQKHDYTAKKLLSPQGIISPSKNVAPYTSTNEKKDE